VALVDQNGDTDYFEGVRDALLAVTEGILLSCLFFFLFVCCYYLLAEVSPLLADVHSQVLHPAARVGLFAFSDNISIFNLRSSVAVLHHCVLSQEGGSEVPLEDVLARDSLFVRVVASLPLVASFSSLASVALGRSVRHLTRASNRKKTFRRIFSTASKLLP
jgi:hypothetical protein